MRTPTADLTPPQGGTEIACVEPQATRGGDDAPGTRTETRRPAHSGRAAVLRACRQAVSSRTGAPDVEPACAAVEPVPEEVFDHQVGCRRWRELLPEARVA